MEAPLAAGLLYFPGAMPSFGEDGERTSAELRFYLNQTTTPATVYQDDGLTTPHTFPIASDAFGNFDPIWADTSLTFSATWLTADGQTDSLDNLTATTSANQALYDATAGLKDDVEQLKADTQQIKDDTEAIYGDIAAVQQAVVDAEQAVTDAQAQVTLAAAQVALATTQAGNAASSATAASGSAATATTQAGNAATSATNAATSATDAATSASQARSYTCGAVYTFSSTTTDSDPGTGNLRLNNANPTLATYVYIDNTDQAAIDLSAWIDAFDNSSSTIKGQLYVREGATGKLAIYNVTGGVVDGTGYRKIPVSYLGGSGSAFTNGGTLGLNFSGNGDTALSASVGYSAKTGAYTVVSSDWGSIIDCTSGSFMLTYTSASTLGAGFYNYIRNSGSGVITGPTADGATRTLDPGDEVLIVSDGSSFHALTLKRGGWTLYATDTVGTPVPSVARTNIPQTYASLFFEFSGVGVDTGVQALQFETSINNGAAYSSPFQIGAITNPTTYRGAVHLPHYRAATEVGAYAFGNGTSPGVASTGVGQLRLDHTGGLNAVRWSMNANNLNTGSTFKTWVKS